VAPLAGSIPFLAGDGESLALGVDPGNIKFLSRTGDAGQVFLPAVEW
jgi:hypothetical protein